MCLGDPTFLQLLKSREHTFALDLARDKELIQMTPVLTKVVISVSEYCSRIYTVLWLFPLMVIENLAPESCKYGVL